MGNLDTQRPKELHPKSPKKSARNPRRTQVDTSQTCILFYDFFGSFHEFAIRSIERGEPWDYLEADTSRRVKKAYTTALADASGGLSCTDTTLLRTGISPTARHGWLKG
jgi:hypothetical protein